eukprot:3577982-Lingulodinium_polyedra.AAC.1
MPLVQTAGRPGPAESARPQGRLPPTGCPVRRALPRAHPPAAPPGRNGGGIGRGRRPPEGCRRPTRG